jgi:Arc/MetJ-type ribon-helix-helix transcriptional regulator
MDIRLSPEIAALVEQDMARGGYDSVEEYVAGAIELMHEQEEWFGETLEEERAKLEQSLAEAHRGDVFTEEEVRAKMKAMKAEWIARHQRS